jgi:uncharacterized protein (DUF1330 family)
MSAYVIFEVLEISDPGQLDAYKKAAHPTVRAAGGKVVIAYGRQEVVEGHPLTGVVMIEFPDFDRAQAWYHSSTYQEAATLRKFAAKVHAVIVESL